MIKKLSFIYQYYMSVGLRHSYLDTLLTLSFFVGLHLFIIQEILRKFISVKHESAFSSFFLSSRFAVLFCFGILLISFFVYPKQKLLTVKFERPKVRSQIMKLIIYGGVLLVIIFAQGYLN
jgi:hypothetical protein